jgi:hypothetical protein
VSNFNNTSKYEALQNIFFTSCETQKDPPPPLYGIHLPCPRFIARSSRVLALAVVFGYPELPKYPRFTEIPPKINEIPPKVTEIPLRFSSEGGYQPTI